MPKVQKHQNLKSQLFLNIFRKILCEVPVTASMVLTEQWWREPSEIPMKHSWQSLWTFLAFFPLTSICDKRNAGPFSLDSPHHLQLHTNSLLDLVCLSSLAGSCKPKAAWAPPSPLYPAWTGGAGTWCRCQRGRVCWWRSTSSIHSAWLTSPHFQSLSLLL